MGEFCDLLDVRLAVLFASDSRVADKAAEGSSRQPFVKDMSIQQF